MNKGIFKKSIPYMICFILVTILATYTGTTHADANPEYPVTVYAGSAFCGVSQNFSLGSHNTDELTTSGGVGNDTIESIRVSPGYKVTFYNDMNFSGSTEVVTANRRNISLSNNVSSLVVEPLQGHSPVTAYADPEWTGNYQGFGAGSYGYSDLSIIGNDKMTAIRIAPGYKVTLYKDSGFKGAKVVLTQDIEHLNKVGFNDAVSSMKVEAISPVESCYIPVTAYVDDQYRGSSQAFVAGEYNNVDLIAIGNDKITSLRIPAGYKVTLYEHKDYGGSSVELTQDCDNLWSFNDKTSSMRIEVIVPVESSCIAINSLDDTTKVSLMEQFAPRIWMAEGEEYMASSVEWAAGYMERYYNTNTGNYCWKTEEPLDGPEGKLPFFSGNQQSARCYAFWTEKDFNNIDLSYWQYCPYNLGKTVVGSEFGNHVGDWEHITVRLSKFTYGGVDYIRPTLVAVPYHSSISFYTWNEMPKISGTDHLIVYSAKNSHGMWKDPGNHVYQDIVVAQLTDVCSAGTAMDCWNILNTYEYMPGNLSGRGLGTTTWPSYFNVGYDDLESGAIYQWGNPADGSLFGQPLLGAGPAGPEGHDAIYDWIILR